MSKFWFTLRNKRNAVFKIQKRWYCILGPCEYGKCELRNKLILQKNDLGPTKRLQAKGRLEILKPLTCSNYRIIYNILLPTCSDRLKNLFHKKLKA